MLIISVDLYLNNFQIQKTLIHKYFQNTVFNILEKNNLIAY